MLKKISKNQKLLLLFSLIFLFCLVSPYLLLAQERELEVKYPEIFGLKPETGLPEYVRYLFNFAILITGLILLGVLIYAGVLYLTSAGQPAKLKEAKDRILSAFLGVILLLSGYIIFTTINPELAIFRLPLLEEIGKRIEYRPEFKPEKMTQIFHEIPLGQLLENGLWEEERTNKLKASLTNFEQFLTQEITANEEEFERISDLNKYLKVLTESCLCEEVTGICQKANNFSLPVACMGDPCKEVREKINNVLKINERKSKELSTYKEKLTKSKNVFKDEGRKFRNLMEVLENCKRKGLLTRPEYYDSVALIEEQGGETKLIKSHLPAKDDPLVFYCAVGGTIFDYPYQPTLPFPLPEEIGMEEFIMEPVETGEPLSCPAEIPIGELLGDTITAISYETNSNLDDLIYYIDKILADMTKMTELVSQCNESRCKPVCTGIPNPCYERCALPPKGCGPLFCRSPNLQAIGSCQGEACPRQAIIETTKRIKIYENEILSLLNQAKGSIEDVKLFLEGGEENIVNLKTARAVTQTCLGLGAREAKEEPVWALLRCEMAIGNKGPDGNIITDCHPQNFFCCTSKAPAVSPFPSVVEKRRPPVYTPPPEGPYSPSLYGHNKVPYFSQYDERWRNKSFGCGRTIGSSGCGPTSIAMVLNYFGIKTDPPAVADWVLKNGYRVCGNGITVETCCKAVEALGKEKGLKCKELNWKVKEVLNELKKLGKDGVAAVSGKGAPPYTEGGHYIVLTGIEKKAEANLEFVHYNDSGFDPLRPKRRPEQGKKPIDWFENRGIRAGCVIYK